MPDLFTLSPVATSQARANFGRWPLGINTEMDARAHSIGLPHWSCVSPQGNEWWIRLDRHSFDFNTTKPGTDLYACLRAQDEATPTKL